MEEEKVKNKYALGILGALIGAFVGSIPWVLTYVYANMIYSLLAILIVVGSYYGYKITKAKIDKKLPIILSVSSFIAITVVTFIIIPICLMYREGLEVSIENLQLLYGYDEFLSAIINDYVISVLFCVVIISGIIVNLNKQIKSGVASKDIKLIANSKYDGMFTKEDVEKAKDIFEKNSAIDKNNTITKELIMEDIQKEFGPEKSDDLFAYLLSLGIVKTKSNKYYLSAKAYDNFMKGKKNTTRNVIIAVIVFVVIIALIAILDESNLPSNTTDDNISSSYDLGINGLQIQLPEDMMALSKSQVQSILGEAYTSYSYIALDENGQKVLLVFSIPKTEELTNYSAKDYFKSLLYDANTEIKEENINGVTFYSIEVTSTDGTQTENAYLCDAGDEFVGIDIYSPIDGKLVLQDLIK